MKEAKYLNDLINNLSSQGNRSIFQRIEVRNEKIFI